MDATEKALYVGTKRPHHHDSQLVALLERRYTPLARAAVLRDIKPVVGTRRPALRARSR